MRILTLGRCVNHGAGRSCPCQRDDRTWLHDRTVRIEESKTLAEMSHDIAHINDLLRNLNLDLRIGVEYESGDK